MLLTAVALRLGLLVRKQTLALWLLVRRKMLALARHRPAKLSSVRWRLQTPKCKAIFWILALGKH